MYSRLSQAPRASHVAVAFQAAGTPHFGTPHLFGTAVSRVQQYGSTQSVGAQFEVLRQQAFPFFARGAMMNDPDIEITAFFFVFFSSVCFWWASLPDHRGGDEARDSLGSETSG